MLVARILVVEVNHVFILIEVIDPVEFPPKGTL